MISFSLDSTTISCAYNPSAFIRFLKLHEQIGNLLDLRREILLFSWLLNFFAAHINWHQIRLQCNCNMSTGLTQADFQLAAQLLCCTFTISSVIVIICGISSYIIISITQPHLRCMSMLFVCLSVVLDSVAAIESFIAAARSSSSSISTRLSCF